MKKSQFFVLAIFFMSCQLASAEIEPTDRLAEDIDQRIEAAYQRSEIDYDEAVLNKAYALFDPSRIDSRFVHPHVRAAKCGTPVVREIRDNWVRLRPETQKILLDLFEGRVEKDYTYDSPGGFFKLHYDRTGRDAVPPSDANQNDVPDYIERAALYCDLVWLFEIDSLGYLPPPPDDGHLGDDRYDIVFEDMFYYGYTLLISETSVSSYIAIENDFRGFPPNEDPEGDRWGALKVTTAHEFFHACQYVYDLEEAIWFAEVTAVWMEETAFDLVNDYYNYLPGFFSHPEEALDEGFPYEKVLWGLFLSQNYGRDMIRDLWEECGTVPSDNALSAHDPVLHRYGTTLPKAFKDFTVWNYLTGDRANGSHSHYEEAAFYPRMRQCAVHDTYPVSEESGCPIDHLASCYLSFTSFDPAYAFELAFSGRAGLPWGAMLIYVEGSGQAARYTSAELTLDDGTTGRRVLAEPGLYSQVLLVPSLHSTMDLNVPFVYTVKVYQSLTLDHTPLTDIQEVPGTYAIEVAISPSSLLDSRSVMLHYGFGTSSPISHEQNMSPDGEGSLFRATIPSQPAGTVVNYFISAMDTFGQVTAAPPGAPDRLYTFAVVADTIPPVIVHLPVLWVTVGAFPLEVMAEVSDPYGLGDVRLMYTRGLQSEEMSVLMTASESVPDVYTGMIPPVFGRGDTVFYRLEAVDDSPQNNTARHPESGYHVLEVRETQRVEVTLDLRAGWNMVSLPFHYENARADVLFPGNVGVFAWSGAGYYVGIDTLQVGYGYWVALPEPQRFVFSGIPEGYYVRDIAAGWNMIGGGATPTDTTALRGTPEGAILPGTLSWYDPDKGAYANTDRLNPGMGYWLASRNSGALTHCEEMPVRRRADAFTEKFPWATLTIEQGHATKILEFGFGTGATARFDPDVDRPAPPPPPSEARFDAYFSVPHEPFKRLDRDVRSVESFTSWEFVIESGSLVNLRWDISTLPPDLDVIWRGDAGSIDMRAERSLTVDRGSRYRITAVRDAEAPATFELFQNIPNPFNATTSVRYAVVSDQTTHQSPRVSLKVYNLLGQAVRVLVDEIQEPGYYTVTWDGRDDGYRPVSSGLYFISLESGRFTDVRKMVLLQ